MDIKKFEDVKDTAMKLNEIRLQCPEDYFYLKGFIHCLLQKEDISDKDSRKSQKRIS